MRKILTLTAAVLASFSLFAAEPTTIFSAVPVSTSEVKKTAAGQYIVSAAEATVTGGTLYMQHNDGNNGRKYFQQQSSSPVMSLDGSKAWFTAKLETAIQAGDTVQVAALTNGSGPSNARGIMVTTGDVKTLPSSANCTLKGESATGKEFVVVKYVVESTDDICGKDSISIWRATGNSTYFKDFAIIHPAPNTDPVSTVTINGLAACFVEREISLKASCDKPADEYKWEVDGVEQTGATTSTFMFSSASAGTFAIVCKAKNSFNSDWVASSAHSVIVNPLYTQADVDGSVTWDWENASTLGEIKFTDSSTPKKNDTVVLANVEGMANDANFNSQALSFSGEYAVRVQSNKKLCQGQLLQFTTTVPGKLSVTYSNTGGNPARFLYVNDVKYGEGSTAADNYKTEENISVSAGDVIITAKDGNEVNQYLRFFKVVFKQSFAVTCADAEHGTVAADMSAAVEGEKVTLTLTPESGYEVASVTVNGNAITPENDVYSFNMPGEAANVVATFTVATAIDNTDAAVKATKVLRDGQVLILRDGKFFNTLGVEVK